MYRDKQKRIEMSENVSRQADDAEQRDNLKEMLS